MSPEDVLLDLYNRLTKAINAWSSCDDDGEFSQEDRDHFAGMADGAWEAQKMIGEEITKLKAGERR
jgi:hypothetical protein